MQGGDQRGVGRGRRGASGPRSRRAAGGSARRARAVDVAQHQLRGQLEQRGGPGDLGGGERPGPAQPQLLGADAQHVGVTAGIGCRGVDEPRAQQGGHRPRRTARIGRDHPGQRQRRRGRVGQLGGVGPHQQRAGDAGFDVARRSSRVAGSTDAGILTSSSSTSRRRRVHRTRCRCGCSARGSDAAASHAGLPGSDPQPTWTAERHGLHPGASPGMSGAVASRGLTDGSGGTPGLRRHERVRKRVHVHTDEHLVGTAAARPRARSDGTSIEGSSCPRGRRRACFHGRLRRVLPRGVG